MDDNQTTDEYYTVIYRVKRGRAHHEEWWQQIQPLFLNRDLPISVSAVASFDALDRLDELETADAEES